VTKLSPPDIKEVLRLKHIFGPDRPLAVIPLLVAKKIPAMQWRSAFEQGPWSDDRLKAIWRQDVNPGLACGPLSGPGLIVVDCDNAEALTWAREHLPPTPMRTVTRHGEHWYYLDDGSTGTGNRSDVLGSKKRFEHDAAAAGFDVRLHPKPSPEEQALEKARAAQARKDAVAAGVTLAGVIDIRGRGGQVVLPGAIHPSGFRYAQAEPWHAGMTLPAFDPAWFEGVKWQRPAPSLVDGGMTQIEYLAVRQKEKWLTEARENTTYDEKLRRARGYLATIEGAVGGAGGHDKLFYAACRLVKGFLISADDAISLLLSDYNSRCQPEWSYEEIAHKVDDAVKQLGADDGSLLVDTQKWVDSQKFWVATEWVAEDVDGPNPDAYEGADDEGGSQQPPPPPPAADAAGGNGDEGESEPPPPPALPNAPVPGAAPNALGLPEPDDIRQWRGLWAARGVRYEDLGSEPWDRKKDALGKRWTLPPTTNNLTLVLKHSRAYAGRLAYNALTMGFELDGRNIQDIDLLEIHGRLGGMWNEEMVMERVTNAMKRACHARAYDPWHQFVVSLPAWDGQDHLATFVTEVLGIDPTLVPEAWQQAHTEWRHQLTGAMARNLVPGTKMETILILVGGQGRKKSTLLRELFNGRDRRWDFFTDQDFELRDKDGMMLIGQYPCCEWGEAQHAKNPTMIDRIKAFLARRTDVYRPPFGKALVDRQRRVVFFGTSNEGEGLLHDVTGNRRFYICNIGRRDLDLDRLAAIREQLWAQVLDLYRRHQAAVPGAVSGSDPAAVAEFEATRWWYTTDEEAGRADSLRGYVAENSCHEPISSWLATRVEPFCISDILKTVLDLSEGHADMRVRRDIVAALTRLGARRVNDGRNTRIAGRVGKFWLPPPPATDVEPGFTGGDREF
jgi:hypothetical protein